ncbi:DUF4147 domain-containing protein [Paracoccus sp. TK19116]|uniref:DUF4147 domain-containing protein n=1 Tax=Paracoccus albicereus TaxID=2922394 RepID=A0ABT1MSB9_9RHOB|nr:DUF4147 domain-containing protein [Paracoccus albicereus]MCQ0971204.1 DUF4147 domain-containing protein [Paracoccus albicereus]
MAMIEAGIAAADPEDCVARHLPAVVEGTDAGDWHIIAIGKAARAMSHAALKILPVAETLIVTNSGNDAPLDGARIMVAGHPVPDADGEAAALAVETMLAGVGQGECVLALISGGGSAMLPAPVAGLDLSDKQAVNRLLLASGADITTTNLIRQSLSRLKGGGWLRLSKAPITSLILSDVPGDDLRVIASGGTVAPIGTIAEAKEAAKALGIWDDLPSAARDALSREEDRGALPPTKTILVGSNAQSVAAMVAAGATEAAMPLTGDVADCAAAMLDAVGDVPPGGALAFGGETTVRLTGDGMGGRNQELALRFALLAEGRLDGDWRLACVGSDGRDGPGEAAGGLVGPDTPAQIRAAGIDPDDALRRNDSTPALRAGDALVTIGATGTNVADLAVFVRAAAPC